MWSDTLLELERAYLLQLVAWGVMSMLVGTALHAWLTVGRSTSALLRHFSLQTAVWGLAEFLIAAVRLSGLAERSLASATRLDRLVWLGTGLEAGLIIAGATLAGAGWFMGRRPGPMGAGIGLIVQAAGLLVLDLRFLVIMARAL
jgi:hypothetical protein